MNELDTTITVKKTTSKRINKQKLVPTESANSVIDRLLKQVEK